MQAQNVTDMHDPWDSPWDEQNDSQTANVYC